MTRTPEPLEQALREAVARLDPVPPEVVEAARAAFTWRTIDAELAELAFDSASDAELAGVRGDGPRALTFEAGEVVIDVEVSHGAGGRKLRGQVAAPTVLPTLELQTPAGSAPVGVDALGRFVGEALPPGPVRIRCGFPPESGLRPVTTEWVVI